MKSAESHCRPCSDESYYILQLKIRYSGFTKPGRINLFFFSKTAIIRILAANRHLYFDLLILLQNNLLNFSDKEQRTKNENV